MTLTDEEKDMLYGKYGEGTALAMKIQVAIGDALGAEKMVPISRAHVALSNQEADLWFAEKLVKAGAKCKISPTVNPGFNLEYFKNLTDISIEDEKMIRRTRQVYKDIGATLTYNCTPYLEKNIPRFGEITAFSESSATPFINSVYGARTNRESAQSALCASITGRTPLYGFLIDNNRKGQVLVDVKANIKDEFDYQLLGYLLPKKIGFKTPVFVGLPSIISNESLMNLGAQLNTAGNISMFHIVGITPEAKTLDDAFKGDKPKKFVTVTDDDLRSIQDTISESGGKIDFALFGCPHFTINQVGQVARQIAGKKLAVKLWIMTSFLTKELAKRMGYLQIINEAGGDIVDDTCMDQPCWNFLYGKRGVTDSPKCAYYTKRRNITFVIRRLPECVDAALKGEI
ncbi:aconitase X catalytic domain-containing protein [Thermoanaerobacterium sp. RBIITD]|uniref:aconitase X catalytic domain-containing protein n=1 Tax=Thermoanaerobacterium sp. RBIITD TaxID=1550240 RepID=UPI000BB7A4EE|nr:aconitase X catalytic domain-containing protein [Thermoanaerobacterium sp. RBIITD]SNX54276.1 predicted aconitase subunit 1 [Thermoanaerobacterium sp. RBIITD]